MKTSNVYGRHLLVGLPGRWLYRAINSYSSTKLPTAVVRVMIIVTDVGIAIKLGCGPKYNYLLGKLGKYGVGLLHKIVVSAGNLNTFG